MGRRIDKQSDGKYKVWSSVVDGYILKDATPADIVVFYLEEAKESIVESVTREINKLG